MNERKTSSMLQRVPVILAVTAASYGLQFPPSSARNQQGAGAAVAVSQPATTTGGEAMHRGANA